MTPAKSVELMRIEAAKRLLTDQPQLAVATIAVRCGFLDQERMRRAFVRAIGISPADYRSYFGQRRMAAE
jgi:transcriptional regulator GlxA family with amidase domain